MENHQNCVLSKRTMFLSSPTIFLHSYNPKIWLGINSQIQEKRFMYIETVASS